MLLVEKGNDLSDPEISSEIEKVISEDMEITETFNKFIVNIVPNLKISPKKIMKQMSGMITSQSQIILTSLKIIRVSKL